jgi:hypothetical protein
MIATSTPASTAAAVTFLWNNSGPTPPERDKVISSPPGRSSFSARRLMCRCDRLESRHEPRPRLPDLPERPVTVPYEGRRGCRLRAALSLDHHGEVDAAAPGGCRPVRAPPSRPIVRSVARLDRVNGESPISRQPFRGPDAREDCETSKRRATKTTALHLAMKGR